MDARTDVYSVAAVGYFLLTGSPVFTGESVMEICMQHVHAAPEPPSLRAGKRISPDLEVLLLRCLAKVPSDRPADAAQMQRELDRCAVEGTWTADDAAAWWADHERGAHAGAPSGAATPRPRSQDTPAPGVTMAYVEAEKK